MKLADFALLNECPRRPDGQPLAISSISDHLKGWKEKIKKEPPAGTTGNKQKERASSYPFLEHFLALWIDAAEYAKVQVTDDIIRAQARIIQEELVRANVDKPYDGFEMSNGWLQRFKNRHNIGRLRTHGQSGDIDQSALPAQRQHLKQKLATFSPEDRYNCDESGLVFNKQPQSSNVRLDKGKQLRGGKEDKIRITTFHIVNETGTDKRKIWVIGRAAKPMPFRQNRINPANLPVIYRHNKKAWLLTGLWYEFLRKLNDEMRIARRHIALVTDNCPTHPQPTSPPIDYKGPPPPILSHVTLVYLPPNTTSFLQPLDAGIIASFKAAYRRRYAQFMVEHFNSYGKAPLKIDILQAIYLIADSWDAVTEDTIVHCWKKAAITEFSEGSSGLSSQINCDTPSPIEHFISLEQHECQQALSLLREQGVDQIECLEDFLNDEERLDSPLDSFFPDVRAIVHDGVAEGILLHTSESLDRSEPESDGDDISTLPVIGIETAAHYSFELQRLLQTLPVTHLPLLGRNSLSVEELITSTYKLHSALLRYSLLYPTSLQI
ncbi:unnamed protein product [Tuber aestivum]|uniref:HTH CENPB-type domain-containing protein n=1 Tax=Tuber aestivum TaxID=59557 RepID=A0A292PM30_9PEZI|nr:unnamed protein product [Tuber aestivum]